MIWFVIVDFLLQGDALKKLKTKNYHQKYLNENKDIYLVVIEFDSEQKNLSAFEWERTN